MRNEASETVAAGPAVPAPPRGPDPAVPNPRSALFNLTLARLREFYREPAAVFWVYGFPLFLALILGVAFQDRPVERIAVAVAGDPADPAAVKLKAALETDPRVAADIVPRPAAEGRLRTGKVGLVVTPAAGTPGWAYTLDPNRPEGVLAKAAADSALVRASAPTLGTPTETAYSEPGGRYIDFLVPGLVGANLMGGGLFGVGFVIVDMRVRKLLKRFLATPMKKRDFLLSLTLSRLLFTVAEVGVLLAFGHFAFGVKVSGDPTALAGLVVLGGATFAGLGLLLASRARTVETVSGLMNLVMLPSYVASGVFFPADRFPAAVQPVLQLLPLTALNDGLRQVINEGGGWGAVAAPAAVLAAWLVGSFALAGRLFRWL